MRNRVGNTMLEAAARIGKNLGRWARARSATDGKFASSLRSSANRLDGTDKSLKWKLGIPAVVGTGLAVGIYTGHDSDEEDTAAVSGLGPEVDALVAMSPTLAMNLERLQAEGWTITYHEIDARGRTYHARKLIAIDRRLAKAPITVTAVFAHESAHALNPVGAFVPSVPEPGESYSDWLTKNLEVRFEREADAELTNAQIRQEIRATGGPDIHDVNDITASAYNELAAGKISRAAAVDRVADDLFRHPGGWARYGNDLAEHWRENGYQAPDRNSGTGSIGIGSNPPEPRGPARNQETTDGGGSAPGLEGVG
ncbi:hypothetical protein AB0M34_21370 [Nocardia sp. NPDC050193]